ncbi:GntR family transcriptional regulator [Bordetella petrii]|uniref:GntR family transcriptional regulator n=1 Tax=Bordetella petrii TaxID=94624 RepID=UPI001E4118EC|nr:GntR family transcriptional regulator [Bordetella petrii]MCD0503417.1 GntR family transcriptional regulator [Bordetella petrii]
MSSHVNYVVSSLRGMILAGQLAPGERIRELRVAAQLNVSRTPIRLALSHLESEGLLERLPARGFQVRAFSIDAIADAIDVRGALEGMAARRVLERGAPSCLLDALAACVRQGQLMIDQAEARPGVSVDPYEWSRMNGRFHGLIVECAGSAALTRAIRQNDKTPLAGANALALTASAGLETTLLKYAQAEHGRILEALRERDSGRAEWLMREHARLSRDSKRRLIGDMRNMPRHAAADWQAGAKPQGMHGAR